MKRGQGTGGEEERDETIVVRRSVYDAALRLDEEAAAIGWHGFDRAELKVTALRDAGDTEGAAFWREVWAYLMAAASVGAGTEVRIVEDGGGGEPGR